MFAAQIIKIKCKKKKKNYKVQKRKKNQLKIIAATLYISAMV